MLVLDTDIMVDVLRGYQPALEWLASLDDAPVLPGFVVMELMGGCRNRREMDLVSKLCTPFRIFWPTAYDCNRAVEDFRTSHLSHNLGILDAVIAEMVVGLGATLFTFNLKHFRSVDRLTTVAPYEKSRPYDSDRVI
ncbi:MAG: PIN domain-containing protein [Pseudomonadota bacterium]